MQRVVKNSELWQDVVNTCKWIFPWRFDKTNRTFPNFVEIDEYDGGYIMTSRQNNWNTYTCSVHIPKYDVMGYIKLCK